MFVAAFKSLAAKVLVPSFGPSAIASRTITTASSALPMSGVPTKPASGIVELVRGMATKSPLARGKNKTAKYRARLRTKQVKRRARVKA